MTFATAVNTVSRKTRVVVSGLDVSDLVEYYEVGDDRVDATSGLISTRGTLKLRYNPKFNIGRDPKISFDPKIPHSAQYWARGQAVKIWLHDTTLTERKHPRHSLRVLKATYDRYELSLTLEIGCLLALLDSPQPEGDESNTCVNEKRPADAVIGDLVRAAGATYPAISPVYVGVIPGFISAPQDKGAGGSYISQAGEIAAERGYALWVTKDEEVTAIRIIQNDSNARIVLEVDRNISAYNVNASDTESSEAPYDTLRVRYTLVTIKETDQSYESYSESRGGTPSGRVGLIATSRVKDYIQGNKRIIHTINQKPIGEAFSWWFTGEDIAAGRGDRLTIDQEIFETYTYEDAGGWDQDNNEACPDEGLSEDGKQGRLLEYEKQVLEQANKAITEWASMHETSGFVIYPDPNNKERDIRVSGWVEAEKERTTYEFFKPENQLGEGEENVAKQTTLRWLNEGYIFPKAWAYRNGVGGDVPNKSVFSGREEITWRKRLGASEWEKHTYRTDLIGVASRSVVEARLKQALEADYSLVMGGARNPSGDLIVERESTQDRRRASAISNVRRYALLVTATENRREVSATQVNPPSPEYIPEKYSREEEEIVKDILIVSPFALGGQGRTKEIELRNTVERKLSNANLSTQEEVQDAINEITASGRGARGLVSAQEQANQAASVESFLTWGRFRAIDCTYDLMDLWFDLPQLPLTRFDVIETDRITEETYRHSYIVDGWSNAVTLRECLCSHDGLWLGTTSGIRQEEIKVVAPIDPGATAIEVQSLAFSLAEGDPILVSRLAGVSFRRVLLGASVGTLQTPATTEIPAGTSIMVGGTVVTVATTVPVGGTTIAFTEPIIAPIEEGTTGIAGTVARVTAFTPVGSTAIPIEPATVTSTVTPETATIEVPSTLLTTTLPLIVEVDLVLTVDVQTFEPIEPIISEAVIVLEAPFSNTLIIGAVESVTTVVIDLDIDFTLTLESEATTVIDVDVQSVTLSEATTVIDVDVEVIPIHESEATITLTSESAALEIVESESVILIENEIGEVTLNVSVTSETVLTAEVEIERDVDPSNPFHLIAIW